MRAPSTEDLIPAHSKDPATRAADRPTAALIDLHALGLNFQEVLHRAEGRKILAVVKANAYGHGAVAVSRHLLELGADMLGVAMVEEGRELREAGIDAPVLVMGPVHSGQAETIAALGLMPAVSSPQLAQALSLAALKLKVRVPVHVKIDTGMGRIGIPPESGPAFVEKLQSLRGIEVQGLMTHFADADLRDKRFSSEQMDRFERLLRTLEAGRMEIPLRHAANSAAVLDYRRALFTMVRPGLMLYGCNPLADGTAQPLHPVLSLMTRIAYLKKVQAGVPISYGRTFVTRRESLIATIPIGYADGYSRDLSNRGEVLIRGRRAPVVGRVCMDMCMIDVTEVPGVEEQDEVVLIGRQGSERISAEDIAARSGTIAYEVLCGIGGRVPRVYV